MTITSKATIVRTARSVTAKTRLRSMRRSAMRSPSKSCAADVGEQEMTPTLTEALKLLCAEAEAQCVEYQAGCPRCEAAKLVRESIQSLEEAAASADAQIQACREADRRIAELEKDAQRYRWLRTRWGRLDELYEGGTMVSMRELVGDDVSMWGFNVEPETLDACIDKAMEASK